MPRIFISYRYDDSQHITEALHERMCYYFGPENVFLDAGKIPAGVDFRYYLYEQIAASDVVLVVIGPQWLPTMAEYADYPDDLVRIGIENALRLDKLVVPVMVMGADMPSVKALPESIVDLKWRNGVQLSGEPELAHECEQLATEIVRALAFQPPGGVDLRSHVSEILPAPFAWKRIPAGTVVMQRPIQSMLEIQTFSVDVFWMARYPVTNAQYAVFVENGGYADRRWWTEVGWSLVQHQGWQEPRLWQNPAYNGDDYPVGGVSWHEAVAFCKWLSAMANENIVLPTEQQWQRAAQGDEEYLYPWGNRWDPARCNHSVPPGSSGGTTPVTYYEGLGDSPYGVVDMVGNLGEWCRGRFENGAQPGTRQGKLRVQRGGGWNQTATCFFHSADRAGWPGDTGDEYHGFRIARLL